MFGLGVFELLIIAIVVLVPIALLVLVVTMLSNRRR
ncbi:twin-arginine translocase TatA/TatE family subunit [Nocardioides luti]|nr:twin-arginine translocase TatA/TatE family subunit [Nocardioides luti]